MGSTCQIPNSPPPPEHNPPERLPRFKDYFDSDSNDTDDENPPLMTDDSSQESENIMIKRRACN